ncbi:MAG: MaoC family dehydratase [Sediminimonas sp.]|uniref:MaoC family dehydratase n=1 Tax=Sediminimonas sp. TaxID=2823379 RepID=UPI002870A6B0|nr:MaoC family dehydratase [Sediminimonas sp.]MDR9484934.1 MaoC family dehydratase [Sediminimonas sp.]
MLETITRADMAARVGQSLGSSRWFTVDQSMIDGFADITHDHQFIHVDPAAAAQTPFGGTIAHGFLTLSLLSAMVYDAVPTMEGVTMGVNYGFDRVRFVSPVMVNARMRGHFTLAAFDEPGPDEVQTTLDVEVEIEGADKPALVARWLGRRYFGGEK